MDSWVLLLLLLLVAAIAVPAVLGLVSLLASPGTRLIGLAGLALLAMVVGVVSVGTFAFLLEARPSAAPGDRDWQQAEDASQDTPFSVLPVGPAVALASEDPRPVDLSEEAVAEAAGSPVRPTADAEEAAAEARPDWVEAAPHKVGGVYRMTAMVGPYSTRLECDQKLSEALQEKLDEYLETYLGPEAAGRVRLEPGYVRDHIAKQQWEETKQFSVGPMIQVHVLMEFDRAANARIDEAWEKAIVTRRLGVVGGLGAVVLLLLSAVWTYLKIDLATAGRYRGRLRLAATVAILAGVAAVLLVSAAW